MTERLHRFLNAYGLAEVDRATFTTTLDERRAVGETFTRRRIELGERAFVEKWATSDGEHRLAVEREWIRDLPPGVAME